MQINVSWSPFYGMYNNNMVVIGDSVSRVKLLDDHIRNRSGDLEQVFVMDFTGDLVKELGVEAIDVNAVGVKIDPFSVMEFHNWRDKEREYDEQFWQICQLIKILLDDKSNNLQDLKLTEALRKSYEEHKEQTTLQHVIDILKARKGMSYDLGVALEGVINDEILSGDYEINLSNNLVVLDFSNVKDPRKMNVLSTYVLSNIYFAIRSGNAREKRNIIINDGCGYIKQAGLLETISRKLRKLRGSLVVSGSSVCDFECGSSFDRAWNAFSQATWKCFLKQDLEQIEYLESHDILPCHSIKELGLSELKDNEFVIYGDGSLYRGEV